jgi:hypothetical protein
LIANDEVDPASLLSAWQTARGPITEKNIHVVLRERAVDHLREMGIAVNDPVALDAAWNNRAVLWRFAGRQVHALQDLMRAGLRIPLTPLGSRSAELADLRKRHLQEWEEAEREGMSREAFDLRVAQRRVADVWPSRAQAA